MQELQNDDEFSSKNRSQNGDDDFGDFDDSFLSELLEDELKMNKKQDGGTNEHTIALDSYNFSALEQNIKPSV